MYFLTTLKKSNVLSLVYCLYTLIRSGIDLWFLSWFNHSYQQAKTIFTSIRYLKKHNKNKQNKTKQNKKH